MPLTKEGVSRVESVTQPGSSWKAQFGGVFGAVALVAQFVPSAQVPVGVQLAAPGVKEVTQPAGRAGAVTPSKFWLKTTIGVQVWVGVAGVGVGIGVVVGVGVGGGVKVGDGWHSLDGPRTATVIGAPVLKKPIVAFVKVGGVPVSNRKLYKVPQRMAFAFGFWAKVCVDQLAAAALPLAVQGALL